MKHIKIKRIFESEIFKDSPRIVNGEFNCYNKNLLSLMGGPEQVLRGSFLCGYNKLLSLEGAPIRVDKDFVCSDNELISLKGSPVKVGGDFDCSKNKLETLEGSPTKIGETFWALNNRLKTLIGGPVEVGKDYHINDSTLRSLKGLPHYLRGNLFLPNHIQLDKKDLYNKSKLKTEKEFLVWMNNNLEKSSTFIYLKDMFTDKFIKKNGHIFSIGEFNLFNK